jgi:hypothetical protein
MNRAVHGGAARMNQAPPTPAVSPAKAASGWLLGPAADLALVANLAWPLVFALVWANRRWLHGGLELFLTSVIGTPHRWVTLGLVANDRERLRGAGTKLAAVGALTVAAYAGTWAASGGLGLAVLGAFLWNVWHVAAQHAGIARVYAVRGRPGVRTSGVVERWVLRPFVVYAYLRMANLGGAFAGWSGVFGWVQRASLSGGAWDWLALGAPLLVLAHEAADFDRRLVARYVHLASVCALYSSLILLSALRLNEYALALAVAIGVFHAVEYYGFLTWSMGRRVATRANFFAPFVAARWTLSLAAFLALMAGASLSVAAFAPLVWIAANTLASMLHYAYDGVLWKIPAVFPAEAA